MSKVETRRYLVTREPLNSAPHLPFTPRAVICPLINRRPLLGRSCHSRRQSSDFRVGPARRRRASELLAACPRIVDRSNTAKIDRLSAEGHREESTVLCEDFTGSTDYRPPIHSRNVRRSREGSSPSHKSPHVRGSAATARDRRCRAAARAREATPPCALCRPRRSEAVRSSRRESARIGGHRAASRRSIAVRPWTIGAPARGRKRGSEAAPRRVRP